MDQNYGYVSAMRKYFQFSGRSPRKEYWLFILVYAIISIIAGFIDLGLGYDGDAGGPVGGLVSLVHLIPATAVLVRRLHDIGRTGWWAAAPLALSLLAIGAAIVGAFSTTVPGLEALGASAFGLVLAGVMIAAVVLTIVIFVFTVLRSQEGENRYGPHPYGQVDVDVF